MATKFATLHHPWTGASLPQHMTIKKVAPALVDLQTLSIASDPLPSVRVVSGKYDKFLKDFTVGQNIRCKPCDVSKMAHALRNHVEKTGMGNVRIKSQKSSPDGVGRVWLLAKEVNKLKVAS